MEFYLKRAQVQTELSMKAYFELCEDEKTSISNKFSLSGETT